MKRKLLFATVVALWAFWPSQAMEYPEVKPYEFAQINEAHIWKGVHEGCEYYVIQEHHFEMNHGDSISNSLSLGRGCK
jgi:hypothetical protein